LTCRHCGITYTGASAERVLAAPEFYQQRFYEIAREYRESLKQAATQINDDDRERVRLVSRHAGLEAGSVLDVGCGGGSLLAAFRAQGWHCSGIEPSTELCAFAREAVGCEVHQGVLETIEFPAASFDALTACHVLEHSYDPLAFLGRCRGLLRAKAVLLVEVPDFGCWAARRQGPHWLPLYPEVHAYHFTTETLSNLLHRAGFRPVHIRRYGGLGILDATAKPDPALPAPGSWCDRIKQLVFQSRHALYRVPGLKRTVRYAYWHVLGMNSSLRLVARRLE
jgi:SAM-dependent methyltransferase